MSKILLHTPEGVRDIYGDEYKKKLVIEKLLHDKINSYGYADIQTPTFEFFDVFSKEVGTIPSKELYKFFDKEGNTLVLRPDFTPSMARCAAKYFMEEDMPIRFSYVGNTFTNTSNLQGKLKETTQMGAELIGDTSIEADAEMISLVIECLLNTGLKEFQISIGEADFFRGLCVDAGLSEETESQLRELISNKNAFGAEDLLIEKSVSLEYRNIILKITDMFGSVETMREAKTLVKNKRSLKAIERLESLYEVLCLYGIEQYVSFDLGMLSKYHYYTGIIFKAYTYGIGDAVVKGGRYDNLLTQFGKSAGAIGFVINIDDLLSSLSRQKIAVNIEIKNALVLYTEHTYKNAVLLAKTRREHNHPTLLMEMVCEKSLEHYLTYAKNNGILNVFYFETENTLCGIDPKTGNKKAAMAISSISESGLERDSEDD